MQEIFSAENLLNILKGGEDWPFHFEIVFRTLIMYVFILLFLSVLGKRGVKQLSVFELVIIIGFGSAAGDPMFYKEVGLLNAFVVLLVIVLCYKLTTWIVFKNETIEKLIEGRSIYLIENGKFALQNFQKEQLGYDEFFSEMRQQGISHIGQVDLALIETSGNLSVYFTPDEKVKFGLPILPHLYEDNCKQLAVRAHYSCIFCGFTDELGPAEKQICPDCKKDDWVKSLKSKRIT